MKRSILEYMKSVLVCGSIAYDRIMDFDGSFGEHFMPDKLHQINVSFFVSPPRREFGGCAGNIAYSLSLLGEWPAIAATGGSDFGEYRAWLEAQGIDPETVAIDEDLPTATSYIMTDLADNQITAFSGGALAKAYDLPLDMDEFALAIISPTAKADMISIAERCRLAEIPFLFDPGQQIPVLSAEEVRTAIRAAVGVFVNDYELALLLEKSEWSEAELVSEAGFVAVTLGAEGSRILTEGAEDAVRAVAVESVVDPTGAGDAYRAGFIAGFVRGLPLPVCAKLGGTVAAYAVECYGTQNHRFTRMELAARYETAYQEPFPL